jgi:hypothetical protein
VLRFRPPTFRPRIYIALEQDSERRDTALSSKFEIRLVDADYELTRFGNNFTGGNNSQSNFRFQTGVQFRF